jgi:hypothetical protein
MLPSAGCAEILPARSSVSVVEEARRDIEREEEGRESLRAMLEGGRGAEGHWTNRCGAAVRVMEGLRSVEALVAGRAARRRQRKAFILSDLKPIAFPSSMLEYWWSRSLGCCARVYCQFVMSVQAPQR